MDQDETCWHRIQKLSFSEKILVKRKPNLGHEIQEPKKILNPRIRIIEDRFENLCNSSTEPCQNKFKS